VIKLFGAKLMCVKLLELYLVSFGLLIRVYSKLIGWEIEGMKYAAAGGDQAFLIVVHWWKIVNYCLVKSFSLYYSSIWVNVF
jgi:hypothetical protein